MSSKSIYSKLFKFKVDDYPAKIELNLYIPENNSEPFIVFKGKFSGDNNDKFYSMPLFIIEEFLKDIDLNNIKILYQGK